MYSGIRDHNCSMGDVMSQHMHGLQMYLVPTLSKTMVTAEESDDSGLESSSCHSDISSHTIGRSASPKSLESVDSLNTSLEELSDSWDKHEEAVDGSTGSVSLGKTMADLYPSIYVTEAYDECHNDDCSLTPTLEHSSFDTMCHVSDIERQNTTDTATSYDCDISCSPAAHNTTTAGGDHRNIITSGYICHYKTSCSTLGEFECESLEGCQSCHIDVKQESEFTEVDSDDAGDLDHSSCSMINGVKCKHVHATCTSDRNSDSSSEEEEAGEEDSEDGLQNGTGVSDITQVIKVNDGDNEDTSGSDDDQDDDDDDDETDDDEMDSDHDHHSELDDSIKEEQLTHPDSEGWITDEDDVHIPTLDASSSNTSYLNALPYADHYPEVDAGYSRKEYSYDVFESDSEDDYFTFPGFSKGSGNGYAFPQKPLRNILEIVGFWEYDFEVNGSVYPRVGVWDGKDMTPNKAENPEDHLRYTRMKSLYAKWVHCNRDRDQWYQKYAGMTLSEIASSHLTQHRLYRRANDLVKTDQSETNGRTSIGPCERDSEYVNVCPITGCDTSINKISTYQESYPKTFSKQRKSRQLRKNTASDGTPHTSVRQLDTFNDISMFLDSIGIGDSCDSKKDAYAKECKQIVKQESVDDQPDLSAFWEEDYESSPKSL